MYFSENEVGSTPYHFEIPKDEHIKWYLYELYRDFISEDQQKVAWKNADGRLYGPSKQLFNKKVTPLLEKYFKGFTIWTKSPFTNEILTIDKDGKFEVHKK